MQMRVEVVITGGVNCNFRKLLVITCDLHLPFWALLGLQVNESTVKLPMHCAVLTTKLCT